MLVFFYFLSQGWAMATHFPSISFESSIGTVFSCMKASGCNYLLRSLGSFSFFLTSKGPLLLLLFHIMSMIMILYLKLV
ncbi:hypothetical protein IC582_028531 [Cucumis melo]